MNSGWSAHLSGCALHPISEMCPVLLVNLSLTLFLGEGLSGVGGQQLEWSYSFGGSYVQVPETGETGTQGQLLGVRAQLLERPPCTYGDIHLHQHPAQTDREVGWGNRINIFNFIQGGYFNWLKQSVDFCFKEYLHTVLNGFFLLFWSTVFPRILKICCYLLPLEKITGTDSKSTLIKSRKCLNAFLKLQVSEVIQTSHRGNFMASVTQSDRLNDHDVPFWP